MKRDTVPLYIARVANCRLRLIDKKDIDTPRNTEVFSFSLGNTYSDSRDKYNLAFNGLQAEYAKYFAKIHGPDGGELLLLPEFRQHALKFAPSSHIPFTASPGCRLQSGKTPE